MNDVSGGLGIIRPGQGEPVKSNRESQAADDGKFKEQLAALQNAKPTTAPEIKDKAKTAASGGPQLKFSNHAIERMHARGISFSPEQMAKIQTAIGKASAKGAKEALLLTDENAMIVSVKDNTVVTVMDKASLRDQVFTKIDSTVII